MSRKKQQTTSFFLKASEPLGEGADYLLINNNNNDIMLIEMLSLMLIIMELAVVEVISFILFILLEFRNFGLDLELDIEILGVDLVEFIDKRLIFEADCISIR